MIHELMHRFFGAGKLPAADRPALEAEGLRVLHEGIWGTIRYRNYRAPGRYFYRKVQGFVGSLAITDRRLVAYVFSRRAVELRQGDPKLLKVAVSVEDGALRLAGEASDFSPNQSGTLALRFEIPDAEGAARWLAAAAPRR